MLLLLLTDDTVPAGDISPLSVLWETAVAWPGASFAESTGMRVCSVSECAASVVVDGATLCSLTTAAS